MVNHEFPQSLSAEQRLRELNITLPQAPTPLGAYVPAVQSGNLLFLSGMVPVAEGKPAFVGRLGKDLKLQNGREAAYLSALNALAVARQHLGTLDKITQVVRIAVSVVSTEDFVEQPKIADAISNLFAEIFGKDKSHARLVTGVVSLPFGMPVELEVIFEVSD